MPGRCNRDPPRRCRDIDRRTCGRRRPSRLRGRPLEFVEGPAARALVADLRKLLWDRGLSRIFRDRPWPLGSLQSLRRQRKAGRLMRPCRCSERRRPICCDLPTGSNERPRQWVVIRRNWAASAFEGYRRRWSDQSTIACLVCGACWRTKMDVSPFPDAEKELYASSGGQLLPPAESLK